VEEKKNNLILLLFIHGLRSSLMIANMNQKIVMHGIRVTRASGNLISADSLAVNS
jgi:hypothetical protein